MANWLCGSCFGDEAGASPSALSPTVGLELDGSRLAHGALWPSWRTGWHLPAGNGPMRGPTKVPSASREPGSGTARNHWDVERRRRLGDRFRQWPQAGCCALGGRPVRRPGVVSLHDDNPLTWGNSYTARLDAAKAAGHAAPYDHRHALCPRRCPRRAGPRT